MMRRMIGTALAVGFVLGGWSGGAQAQLMLFEEGEGAYLTDDLSHIFTNGQPTFETLQNASETFRVEPFGQFELEWFDPKPGNLICTSLFSCEYDLEVYYDRTYFVDVVSPMGYTITLTAGAEPFSFAYEIAPVPLPSSVLLFGTALLALGALAYRRRTAGLAT